MEVLPHHVCTCVPACMYVAEHCASVYESMCVCMCVCGWGAGCMCVCVGVV